MKILHLSDTHSAHHRLADLPAADIVVHSGDFTMTGSEAEAIDFLNWFCDLPYRHKVFICGNHDMCLYKADIDGLDPNVHYLCNSGVEIDGIKFFGIPMFMEDCVSDRQNKFYGAIPVDTDVLITHSPPYGVLDFDDNINYGSSELLARLPALNLKAHLFGHIHAQRGIVTIGSVVFSNGAVMSGDYSSLHSPDIIVV